MQSSVEVEDELLSLSSDSWTPSSRIRPLLLLLKTLLSTFVCRRTGKNWEDKDFADPIDPIENFGEEDMATGSMAVAGRSPKHPRTGSEDDSVDLAALLDRAADHFSACMETKVDSMMDRLDKKSMRKLIRNLDL